MRFIDISFPTRHYTRVKAALADTTDPALIYNESTNGRSEIRIMANENDTQMIVDRVQSVLADNGEWRLVVLPVEAACSSRQTARDLYLEDEQHSVRTAREEIFHEVSASSRLNPDFIVLSALSAIVAALGMNAENVAVVIGAMVIAPLLGPILSFSFGAAIGDLKIMTRSARTALAGVATGVVIAYCITFFVEVNTKSAELLSRAEIGIGTLVLALASGAAAALSLVTGLSAMLVGVMVAVALLPPSAAIALYMGAGAPDLALKAGALLAANVICVTLAAQIVFIAKGVRPRRWQDQQAATRSRSINLAVWGVLLVALAGVILYMAD